MEMDPQNSDALAAKDENGDGGRSAIPQYASLHADCRGVVKAGGGGASRFCSPAQMEARLVTLRPVGLFASFETPSNDRTKHAHLNGVDCTGTGCRAFALSVCSRVVPTLYMQTTSLTVEL